jgi:tRNA A-37 threonylcarbamoyl transferase component Bud32
LPGASGDDSAWAPGSIIDNRYRIEGRVGGGASGEVYRARHIGTGGAVALKRLRADRADSEHLRRRFAFEAQVTHTLRHPNTVRVIDTGVDGNGRPWLAMEWLEGRTLAEVVAIDGPLPMGPALAFARQLLGSLAEAHEARLVHRDIKPQNLMVLKVPGSTSDVHLKVLDFGIAKDLNRDEVQTMHPVGTPRWMAPEMWLGAPAAPSADVFAAGCVVFHMLTGESAFDGADDALAVDEHDARAWLGRLRSRLGARGVPPAVVEVIASMMAPRRADRPAHAGEALARLDAALASGQYRRPRVVWLVAGVVFVACVGVGAILAATSAEEAQLAREVATSVVERAPAQVAEIVPETPPMSAPDVVASDDVVAAASADVASARVPGGSPPVPLVQTVALDVFPENATLAVDDAAFGPPPTHLPLPERGRSVKVVVQAPGHETLKTAIDADGVAALDGGPWKLHLKRKVATRRSPPGLDLEGLDILPRSTP